MARITRTLAVGALALGTATAVAGPAQAHHGPGDDNGGHHGFHHGFHHASGIALTPDAQAALDAANVSVRLVENQRRAHHGNDVVNLRSTVVFDGAATTTWKRIRINERTNRVTAVVNGDREAVLRFRGNCDGGSMRLGHHRGGSVLRLTSDGAASVDHAAGKDVFDAGDAFATGTR